MMSPWALLRRRGSYALWHGDSFHLSFSLYFGSVQDPDW